jgi:YidC/Oxa1 family membrane protein insertase
MEKRVIIAFVLSIAVVWGFQTLFRPSPPASPAPVTTQQEPAAPTQTADVPKPVESAPPSEEPLAAATDIAATGSEEAVIDTPLYAATISNVGGVLKSYKLKTYTDATGNPIELINQPTAEKLGWPLGLESSDESVNSLLKKANYRLQREGDVIHLEFAGQGIHAVKTLQFERDNYQVNVDTALEKNGSKLDHRLTWRAGFGDQSLPPDPARILATASTGAKFETVALNKIEGVVERSTPIAGIEDKYFLAAFILPAPGSVQITKQDFAVSESKIEGIINVAVPASDPAVRVYIGPKDEQWLGKADARLKPVVNYGFFEVITRPLLAALLWIHSYIGNFGWAIIILTLGINFILFPLRLKQQLSMQKMQKLQPQMRTLQDRYKKLKANDPRRAEVQMEMMNLYKANGVNPMGGCLPLLLQMPLLFAFWNMLSVSIDLRQAPWILWVKDLSQYDPYYIIPILMAVSMIISQKMMPTTVDPAQAKMMLIMPVLLTAMFLWLQSGVTLYYLTSNVVGIGQQWFIKKYWSSEPPEKTRRNNKPTE